MVETTLDNELETSGQRVYCSFGISLDVIEFFRFGLFFSFFFCFFFGFGVFLVHPTVVLVLLSALVKRFDVSRMRDFFKQIGFLSIPCAPENPCFPMD